MTAVQADAMALGLPGVFTRLHPAADLAPPAMHMARSLDRPIYDCFYLALAERENARMVTADRRLAERLKKTSWQERVRLLAGFEAER